MEFQRQAGLALGAAIKPIEEGTDICDEIVRNDVDCGKAARYALVVRSPSYLCDTHKLWDE